MGSSGIVVNREFVIADGVLRQYSGTEQNVNVPAEVTEIGEKAFENNITLTSIVIPAGVNKIGVQAFQGCINLRYITMNRL